MMRQAVITTLLLCCGSLSAAAQVQQGADRDDRWRADIRFFATELVARHKNAFAYVDRPTFTRAVAELDSAVPKLTDVQIQLRIARLAALLRDGHTNVAAPRYAARLPFTVLWLADGPHIVDATKDQAALVGARILKVNGHPIAEVADSLRLYLSHENELGFWWRGPSLFTRPGALRDIGLATDSSATTLDIEKNGTTSTVVVPSVASAGFVTAPSSDIPIYRQRAGEKYWWTYLPNDRTIFVKYNKCVDPEDFVRLADSVAKAIDDEHPLRVVVDLRDNSGGNSEVVQPLIDAIRKRGAVNRPDALYVVMGRVTFSSGLLAAYDFKRKTNATLIGEPTGERPNTYGEVQHFTLPNSKIDVTYSTKYFRIVRGDPESYVPDVSVPPTAEAYIGGRDPAMEWILAHSRTREP